MLNGVGLLCLATVADTGEVVKSSARLAAELTPRDDRDGPVRSAICSCSTTMKLYGCRLASLAP